MSYVENSLSEGETLISRFPLHTFVYTSVFVLFTLNIILFVTVILGAGNEGIQSFFGDYYYLTYIVPVLLFIYTSARLIEIKSIEFALTDRRVIKKGGVFRRESYELTLESIETVSFSQSILGRIFRFGDIIMTGKGNAIILFKNIDKPLVAKKIIDENLQRD